jgi:hypothetical protein
MLLMTQVLIHNPVPIFFDILDGAWLSTLSTLSKSCILPL